MAFRLLTNDPANTTGQVPDISMNQDSTQQSPGFRLLQKNTAPTVIPTNSDMTNTVSSPFSDTINNIGNVMGDVGQGLNKFGFGLVNSAAKFGQNFLNQTGGRVANLISGKGFVPTTGGLDGSNTFTTGSPEQQAITDFTTPNSTAQNIGYDAGFAASLSTPTGIEGAAARGISAIPDAIKTIPYLGKTIPLIIKSSAAALDQGGKSYLAGGDANTTGTISALAAVSPVLGEGISALKGFVSTKAQQSLTNDVSELLNATKSLSKATQDFTNKGIDITESLSNPAILKGIKVVDNKINPELAIQTNQDTIDSLMQAKRAMLPDIDRLTSTVTKQELFDKAVSDIKNTQTPADESNLISRIQNQVNALPDEMSVSKLDQFRAQVRNSARDARGQLKSDSEYSALERASLSMIFEKTDNLPVHNPEDYKQLNDQVRKLISINDFLDTKLRGQVVKGGRIGGYSLKLLGSIAGASHGPFTAIAGHAIGGTVADIIANNNFGSSFKMQLIRNITDNPDIIARAENLVGHLKNVKLPELPPADMTRSYANNGNTIVTPFTTYEKPSQSIYTQPNTPIAQLNQQNTIPLGQATNIAPNINKPTINKIKNTIPINNTTK